MANVQHSAIADPEIHEPKDVATAGANSLYVADGAGSGTWTVVPYASIDIASIMTEVQTEIDGGTLNLNGSIFVTTTIPDISTAGSILVPVVRNGTFVRAVLVLGGAITVADATVSIKNAGGASTGTNVTVPFTGSSKGDTFSFTATGNNTMTAPTYIEVLTDGGSTDPQPVTVTLEFSVKLN